MNVLMLTLDNIHPYQKNARKNDKAVKGVAESIKQFGFQSPIILDKDNIIICGHTRYKAAKKLGLKEVPCIVADNLTDEQVKAYRLADNKVSEVSEWDNDLLTNELIELMKTDINMDDFGFDLPDLDNELIDNEDDKENERVRTGNAYHLDDYDETRCEGFYNMPVLKPCHKVPKDLIGFNYVLSNKENMDKLGVHFFIDDYQFERLWNDTYNYIDVLKPYDCILTCDFSLYTNMPISLQVYNIYRSRLIGQIYQDNGLNVIPTVSWCKKDSFEFCFDGLPHNSTLAISTIGVKQNDAAFEIWKNGVDEMIRRLTPKTLIVYGGKVAYDYGDIKVIYYDNKVTERMKKGAK